MFHFPYIHKTELVLQSEKVDTVSNETIPTIYEQVWPRCNEEFLLMAWHILHNQRKFNLTLVTNGTYEVKLNTAIKIWCCKQQHLILTDECSHPTFTLM